MRVLVVPKWYPWPDRPVFGIFCQEHARALTLRHEVAVIATDAVRSPEFGVFDLRDAVEDGLRTLRVRYRRPRFRPAAMLCQLAGMIVALHRLRREGWRPDVVHAHVYSAALPALIVGRLNGARVVVSEHFTGFQRGLITGADHLTARMAFRYADVVAPVSHDLCRKVRAVQPRARFRVVPNVVDTSVFAPDGGHEPHGRLLTVAALNVKKGHADLFDALVRVRAEHHVTLDVVGDGELRAELEAQVRRLGLAAVVRFHGERPKADVAELMREADLFVLPSRIENLPCVLIEAMASGLPFVATAVGGVPELAGDPGAILCAPQDPESLANAIATALDGLGEIDAAALAARAEERYGYEAIARTWTEIYDELVRSAGTTS